MGAGMGLHDRGRRPAPPWAALVFGAAVPAAPVAGLHTHVPPSLHRRLWPRGQCARHVRMRYATRHCCCCHVCCAAMLLRACCCGGACHQVQRRLLMCTRPSCGHPPTVLLRHAPVRCCRHLLCTYCSSAAHPHARVTAVGLLWGQGQHPAGQVRQAPADPTAGYWRLAQLLHRAAAWPRLSPSDSAAGRHRQHPDLPLRRAVRQLLTTAELSSHTQLIYCCNNRTGGPSSLCAFERRSLSSRRIVRPHMIAMMKGRV